LGPGAEADQEKKSRGNTEDVPGHRLVAPLTSEDNPQARWRPLICSTSPGSGIEEKRQKNHGFHDLAGRGDRLYLRTELLRRKDHA
jgi:hypothetical protein